nr:MAG TPA: hypothetical protein [Bacteriophage sp.]
MRHLIISEPKFIPAFRVLLVHFPTSFLLKYIDNSLDF